MRCPRAARSCGSPQSGTGLSQLGDQRAPIELGDDLVELRLDRGDMCFGGRQAGQPDDAQPGMAGFGPQPRGEGEGRLGVAVDVDDDGVEFGAAGGEAGGHRRIRSMDDLQASRLQHGGEHLAQEFGGFDQQDARRTGIAAAQMQPVGVGLRQIMREIENLRGPAADDRRAEQPLLRHGQHLDVEHFVDDVDDGVDRQRHAEIALGEDHHRLQTGLPQRVNYLMK